MEKGIKVEEIDRCITNGLIKTGVGFGVGSLVSLLFLMRRSGGKKWPILLGSGIGLGMGIANCQHKFNNQLQQNKK